MFEEAIHKAIQSLDTRDRQRIANHAANSAEDVIYLAVGEIVRHRPKAIGIAP